MNVNTSVHKKKNQRGAALGFVLVFMTLIVLLGVALLKIVQYTAAQSVAVVKQENGYYAAESAAQYAMQLFMKELDTEFKTEWKEDEPFPFWLSDTDITKSTLSTELQTLFSDKVETIVTTTPPFNTEFNGSRVELKDIEIVDIDTDFISTYQYTKSITLAVSAVADGRTVRIESTYYNATAESNRTGIDKEEIEKEIENELDDIFGDTATTGDNIILPYDRIPPINPEDPESKRIAKAKSFRDNILDPLLSYVNSMTPTKLFSGATPIPYPDGTVLNLISTTAEYIQVNGDLTISGAVNNCPNLKGIYVTGNLTVTGDGNFTGNWTTFLVNGTMSVTLKNNVNTTLLNSHFYVKESITINLSSSNGDKVALASNSVFVAYGSSDGKITFTGNGGANKYIGYALDGAVEYFPQFYSQGNMNFTFAGGSNTKYSGIYASKGNLTFSTAGGSSSFHGVLVGSDPILNIHAGNGKGLTTTEINTIIKDSGVFGEIVDYLAGEDTTDPDPDPDDPDDPAVETGKISIHITDFSKQGLKLRETD